MASLAEIKQDVRVALMQPRAQRPTSQAILQAVCTHVQSALFNRLSNTGKAWTVGTPYILTVQPNIDTYTLNVGTEYGKALDVSVYDPSNPVLIARSIPFWNVQDMNFNWGLPANIAEAYWSPDGSPNTAQRMAFFRDPVGQVFVKVYPIPQLDAQYEILWAQGLWADEAGLDESPLLAEHHQFPRVRAALALLPHASWFDSEPDNRERRKELAQSLQYEEAIFRSDFDDYVANINNSRMTQLYTMSFDE
jgi:hypothetical protein